MNVLCLEDDVSTQTLIAKIVKGIIPDVVIEVENHAVKALLYSIINNPDFYILDWTLPFFDTSYIIDIIVKQKKPILIYTAFDMDIVYNEIIKKCGELPRSLTLCKKSDTTTLTNFIKNNIVR